MRSSIKYLVCFMALCAGSFVHAGCGGGNCGYGYGYGYGYPGVVVGLQSYTPAPPYFAIHPPVYYGQRYTRPYGVSPFASRPMLQSNSGYAPRPAVRRSLRPALVITNPHYQAVESVQAEEIVGQPAAKKPSEPLVIDNPYIQPKVQYTSSTEVADQ